MLAEFNAPPRDRYQVITQHDEGEMIFEDTGLGFERTNKLIFLQIFQQGRTPAMKKAIYASICSRLNKECDGASAFPSPRGQTRRLRHLSLFPSVPTTDIMVSCNENTRADWSFGLGRAQFLEGDL
jgi:hypothetical protein